MDRRKITTRSLKRKLEQDFLEENRDRKMQATAPAEDTVQDLETDIRAHVAILNSTFSSSPADRVAAKSATHLLCQLAKNEEIVNLLVDCRAVPALVMHLQAPPVLDCKRRAALYEHEVEKGSAFTLGLLAVKPEFQQLIVNAGALSHLVDLLKRHKSSDNSRALSGVIRRSADTITNLAHENCSIKTLVRNEGGIPPLVELLEYDDVKVQRAAAGALRTLAFKNDENKNQIVERNALPTLILMLRSEDAIIHYEAVGVIGNLVHSSPNIKKQVLLAGALQPVIGLLSSPCAESQREAALLLGQFAAANSDCKVHISQRGAVPPLINMLENSDGQLKEMAAFALGRLAQEAHNQAGIAHNGGIAPLLALLQSKNGPLQHNAAFALYGLVDNEDNIAAFIKLDGVQKLLDGEFSVQPTKDCVAKTLKRLEEKIHGPVLNHLLYLLRKSEKAIQRRIALALANLCAPDDRKVIFLNCNGLQLLLDLLECGSLKQQRDSSMALYKLATEAISVTAVDDAPLSPTTQVYLGEQYVNNPTLSDVTFLIEGKQFYAHRICLLASSDTFRAMFDGGYRERDAKDVEIPNIKWDVFELMMRFIYTGLVDINTDIAHDLLIAADRYLLEGLKRLCECTIAKDISVENISSMYDLSESFNATSLKEACLLFVFKRFDKLSSKPWPLKKRVKSNVGQLTKQGKKDASPKRGGSASSRRSRSAATKYGRNTKEVDDSKTGKKVEDKSGGKAKDQAFKSGGKSGGTATKAASKSKTDDAVTSKTSKSREDAFDTPKGSKSKQESPKSGKSKVETLKTSPSVKGKAPKSGGRSNINGTGKLKSGSSKAKEMENKDCSTESDELAESTKKKASSSKGQASAARSGKKRRRA